ncbi:Dynamin [Arthrobotrys entomopaga]|nr:Dynamin [Arthrobotrys entomopaga]
MSLGDNIEQSGSTSDRADLRSNGGLKEKPSRGNETASRTILLDDTIGIEEHRILLDKIDKLRELGVNKILGLPQVVVTGDQSSGKSSVLEALTGLPLPRSSGLCTRFATEISLRRSVHSKPVVISIKPSHKRGQLTQDQQSIIDKFKKKIPEEDLTADRFLDILNEASDVMGIPRPGQRSINPPLGESGFSDDLLSIQLSGPHHSQFSIIDLPGLIRSVADQQRVEDIELIRDMNMRYIQDNRSIILAVFAANVDVANQEVLQLAKSVDLEGERTLGIITKPDRVEAGAEVEVLRTANNKSYRLTLGYFVVRNRGPSEMELSRRDRDSAEREFFSRQKFWNTLPKDRVGIQSLKEYIGKLIFERFRKDLPKIQSEIEDHIKTCEERLAVLGRPRFSEAEQRGYITAVEVAAGQIVDEAFHGRYEKEIFRHNTELKLRQRVRALNKNLADNFISYGNTIAFSVSLAARDGEEGVGGTFKSDGTFESRRQPADEILDLIAEEEVNSRGAELPSLTSNFVYPNLFNRISENWQPIAEFHFRELSRMMKRFHEAVMLAACKDDHVRQKLSERHLKQLTELLDEAKKELRYTIEAERTSILLTENPDFLQTAEVFKDGRLMATLDTVTEDPPSGRTTPPVPGAIRNQVLRNVRDTINSSMTRKKRIEIHDDLRAYYRIARRRIVDTIIIQVFERKVLRRFLELYNPNWAAGLNTEDLQELAGEPSMKARERTEVAEDLKILNAAMYSLY